MTRDLERILLKLNDNAAKYASSSEPAVVSMEAKVRNCNLAISISDRSPVAKEVTGSQGLFSSWLFPLFSLSSFIFPF